MARSSKTKQFVCSSDHMMSFFHSAVDWLIVNFVVWWLFQNCIFFCIVVVVFQIHLEAAKPFLISCKSLPKFLSSRL